ncbi:MAG TPA: NADH-quinone oxidoreductase subunit NuoK [Vicinamibacterales bacterium]|nr:NADH-quinone oxidoreductase subunit NuoK [Vicinamibacterales bacterium]
MLLVAGALFAIGAAGLMARRNVLFMLISLAVMLNAAGLALVAAGARWGQADGQVMVLFILVTAGAETSVGLALVRGLYARTQRLDADRAVGRAAEEQPSAGFARMTRWGWRLLAGPEAGRLRWSIATLIAGTVLFVALVLYL